MSLAHNSQYSAVKMEGSKLQPENTNEHSIFRNIRAALEGWAGVSTAAPSHHSEWGVEFEHRRINWFSGCNGQIIYTSV